jgi:hypothetical protein
MSVKASPRKMRGIHYVVDDNGEAVAVQIDLRHSARLWEDFCDVMVARSRRKEPKESLAAVEARLRRLGKLT